MRASSSSHIKGITESAQILAREVSADQEECSISFNEFLTLNGKQKTANTFTDVFLMTFDMFDHQKKGKIPEMVFRNIVTRKFVGDTAEIEEMLGEYRRIHTKSDPQTHVGEEYIDCTGSLLTCWMSSWGKTEKHMIYPYLLENTIFGHKTCEIMSL